MRQVSKIRIALGVRQDGAFVNLSNAVYDIWNIRYNYKQEYLGGATLESLTGFKRGNPSAFRANITVNLKNTTNANTQAIRTLLGQTSSRFDRTIGATELNPNRPTLCAVWADDTSTNVADAEVCNLIEGTMGVERELTVGNQIITMTFEGVELKKEIPSLGTIYD